MKKIRYLLIIFSLFFLSKEMISQCPFPEMTNLEFNGDGTATMEVTTISGATKYQIRYKKKEPGSNWLFMNESNPVFQILLLEENKEYDYKLRVVCNGNWQIPLSILETYQFQVPSNNGQMDCTFPSETVTINSGESVTLSWPPVPDANRYYLQYRVQGQQPWNSSHFTSTSKTLTGLTEGTTYEYRLNSRYSVTNDWLPWGGTTIKTFTPVSSFSNEIGFEKFIGANVRRGDPIIKFTPVGSIREYHDWILDEGFSALGDSPGYPNNKYKWNPPYSNQSTVNFDEWYNEIYSKGYTLSPCLLNSPPYIVDPSLTGCPPNVQPNPCHVLEQKPIYPSNPPYPNTTTHTDPFAYTAHADHMYHFIARYGGNTNFNSVQSTNIQNKLEINEPLETGLGYVSYVENWNEPDKVWETLNNQQGLFNPAFYSTPQEFAAMMSADYDGHMGQINTQTGNMEVGVINADPNIRMVMGGLGDIDWDYTNEIRKWCEDPNNRGNHDRVYPFDVLNFHHYSNKMYLAANANAIHGFSPEEDIFQIGNNPAKSMKYHMLDLVNKIETEFDATDFPSGAPEIWLTEFGYDTSPLSPQAAIPNYSFNPAIPAGNEFISNLRLDYETRLVPHWNKISSDNQQLIQSIIYETQAQWIVRSLLEISSAGFDRAFIYDIRDVGSIPYCPDLDCEQTGIYGSSGLLEDINKGYAQKTSWYYVSTVKSVLEGKVFFNDDQTECLTQSESQPEYVVNELNNCPRIYEFTSTGINSNSKAEVIAFWGPTSTNKAEYIWEIDLPNNTSQVTLVEMVDTDIDGSYTVVSGDIYSVGNQLKINVSISERPKFLILDEEIITCVNEPVSNFSAQPISCNTARLDWDIAPNTTCVVDYYQLFYQESVLVSDPNNVSTGQLIYYNRFNALGTVGEGYITGLKPATCYYYFIVPVSVDGEIGELVFTDAATLETKELCYLEINSSMISGTNYPTQAAQLFDYTCPTCDYFQEPIGVSDWTDIIASTSENTFDINLGTPHELNGFYLFDGQGTGSIIVEYQSSTGAWLPYFIFTPTLGQTWNYFSNSIDPSTGIQNLRFIFQDDNSRIDKIMICGKPVTAQDFTGCNGDPLSTDLLCNADATFDVVICEQMIEVQSIGGIEGEWDFGDGNGVSNQSAYTHEYQQPGNYIITFTVEVTCEFQCTQEITVPEINIPDASFVHEQTGCSQLVLFTSTSSNWEHTWSFQDVNGLVLGTSDIANPTFNFESEGTFEIFHTVENACGTITESIIIIIPPCIQECGTCSGPFTVIGEDNVETLVSQTPLAGWNFFTNECFEIKGTLIIDVPTRINGGEFKMHPNSEIRVAPHTSTNGTRFRISNGAFFHGCEQMWKGIYVEPNGIFIAQSVFVEPVNDEPVRIEDALIGVAGKSPRMFLPRKIQFDNNFIGVYLTGTGFNNGLFMNNPRLYGCSFENSTGSLVPNTSTLPSDFAYLNNILPGVGLRPYAGAILHNINGNVLIGNDGNFWTNQFRDIANGILVLDSDFITIINATFDDIVDSDPNLLDGYGIYATHLSGTGFLNVNTSDKPNTPTPDLDPTFANCEIGIYTEGVNLTATRNVMENIRNGIEINLSHNNDLFILDNKISANQNGMLINNSNQTNLNIEDNFIEVGINQIGDYGEAGINLMAVSGIDPNPGGIPNNTSYSSNISNNEIQVFGTSFTEGGKGISLSNSHFLEFIDNNIVLENGVGSPTTSIGRSGFVLNNSSNLFFSCNQVTSAIADYWGQGTHFGFFVNNTQKATYNCNRFNRTTEGMRFGSVCESTDLSTNEFVNHSIGLRMDPTAVVTSSFVDNINPGGMFNNTQYHSGNTWTGNYANFGAQHEGTFLNIFLSRFVINEVTGNPCPTSSSDFNPCPISLPGIPATDWFFPQTVLPTGTEIQECDFLVNCEPPIMIINPDIEITELDEAVKQETYLTESFQDEIMWELDRTLIKKLGNNSNMMTDASNSDYYNDKIDLPIGKIEAVENNLQQLFVPAPSIQTAINNSKTIIYTLNDNIQAVAVELEISTGQDSIDLENELLGLHNQLSVELDTYQGYVNQIKLNSLNQIVNIESQNNTISSNVIYESNERAINEIFASTVAKGIKKFTNSQLDILEQIGSQCPIKGGNRAVYQARAMARLANIIIVQTEICNEFNAIAKGEDSDVKNSSTHLALLKEQSNQESDFMVKIFPNPAIDDDIQVTFDFPIEASRELIVYDFFGRKIEEYPINSMIGEVLVKTNTLNSGLHWFSIYANGHPVFTEKVIIQNK